MILFVMYGGGGWSCLGARTDKTGKIEMYTMRPEHG